jgi:hypothetical protein
MLRHLDGRLTSLEHRSQIRLFEDVLRTDLPRTQLALSDPPSDGLGISAGALGGFGNGQHRRRILQHDRNVGS